MAERLRASRPARLEEVQHLAAALKGFCHAAGVSDDVLIELELALVEAANNIVVHGFRERGAGELGLSVSILPGEVEIELTDEGPPVPPASFEPRPISFDAESGRGMAIIHGCVDRVEYRRVGNINHLRLVKRINPAIREG